MKNKHKKEDVTELGVFSIRINSDKINKQLLSLLYKYRHFENILLILIKVNYNLYIQGKDTNDFKYLTNKNILRNALFDYKSKNKNVNYLKEKYKDNELWKSLKEVAKSLKSHNLVYVIDRVRTDYKNYFADLKSWKEDPNSFTGMPKPPKPKRISKLKNYSIELDRYTALSFANLKSKDLIGINLSNKMIYIHCNVERVLRKKRDERLTEIDKLYSARLVFDNGFLSLQVSYLKDKKKLNEKSKKLAGIDVGLNNLAGIFIDDKTTPSLLVDGKPFKHYNAKFNRLVSKLNEEKSKEVLEYGITKTGTKYPLKYTERGERINKFIKFLYAKRNRYFYDQFHKASKHIVEYLYLNGVLDLYISRNLSELKNNGECNLRKDVKQNFIEIPFIQFLKYIEYKAQEYGITVHWIDEKYSSQASSLSGNVKCIQNDPQLTNAFNGRRVKRGLFLDTKINKVFNADINGAVNHIRIGAGKSFDWLKDYLFKLSNPVKIKSDYDFCRLIEDLQNSVGDKSTSIGDVEASQPDKVVDAIKFC